MEKFDDPEIAAMQSIGIALTPLEQEARMRVMKWALSKFSVTLSMDERKSVTDSRANVHKPNNHEEVKEGLLSNYRDLAEFIDAANPKKDYELALVTAYYLQKQTEDDVSGFQINSSLRNLGRRVGNVTNAMGTLVSRKPTLIIVASKSGTSFQSRKKYRVTTAGEKEVARMISHASTDEAAES